MKISCGEDLGLSWHQIAFCLLLSRLLWRCFLLSSLLFLYIPWTSLSSSRLWAIQPLFCYLVLIFIRLFVNLLTCLFPSLLLVFTCMFFCALDTWLFISNYKYFMNFWEFVSFLIIFSLEYWSSHSLLYCYCVFESNVLQDWHLCLWLLSKLNVFSH
jgi:hypothetical protein